MPTPRDHQFDRPLTWLRSFDLDRPVVSCADAAAAKSIPLTHELKTLVIATDSGLVVTHTCGDDDLSLRRVKQVLGHDQSQLASPATLSKLELSPGTVHPFAPALADLVHLTDARAMDLPWVSTNDGTLDHYVVFSPWLLHGLRHMRVTVIAA